MSNASKPKRRRKGVMVGLGLDSDGHKRLTTGFGAMLPRALPLGNDVEGRSASGFTRWTSLKMSTLQDPGETPVLPGTGSENCKIAKPRLF
jgi:hypothetical protein